MKITICLPLLLLLVEAVVPLAQARTAQLLSPHPGVLCDPYFCAGKDEGVSVSLTRHYLGVAAAEKLAAQGAFDKTTFSYANGVFCDLTEKKCRANRYFDAKGNRSGAVRETESRLLFGMASGG